MGDIARNEVKKPKTLKTAQKAIWCGMWVTSLGLFLIAGCDILGSYGWSLYSVLVLGAVGLGPLLVLTMLCGFNISEMRVKDTVYVATRAQVGQFRQADLLCRARRQLEWNSLVRTPVPARIIPLTGRHLQPGGVQGDQRGHHPVGLQRREQCGDGDVGQRQYPGQPYLEGSVLKMALQVPIVALALLALSADVASAWPSGLEPASAMYWCSSDTELNTKNAFTVWVDKTKQVVAVSPSRNGSILPEYAEQLVGNEDANSGLNVRTVKMGYYLTPGSGRFSHQFKIANTAANCMQTSED